MRSTIKTIAIATFALSVATSGAFAASRHEPREPHWSGYIADDHAADDPTMTTLAEASPVMSHPTAHKPRLTQVLAQLNATDRAIQRDKAMDKLSASAARKLEGNSSSIRRYAMHVAYAHHGAIPKLAYQRLQNDIRKLDRDVSRLA